MLPATTSARKGLGFTEVFSTWRQTPKTLVVGTSSATSCTTTLWVRTLTGPRGTPVPLSGVTFSPVTVQTVTGVTEVSVTPVLVVETFAP